MRVGGTRVVEQVAGVFNIGDLIGKAAPCTPALILGGKWRLLLLATLRIAFIPILLLIKGLTPGMPCWRSTWCSRSRMAISPLWS